MVASTSDKPVFLIKKFAGLALLLFGVLLTAIGFANKADFILATGAACLVAGAALLVLKVVRRNRDSGL